jgi:hypothetical protein
MSQNSNTTLPSDSNILFSLNSDCDSGEDNEIDLFPQLKGGYIRSAFVRPFVLYC